MASPSLCHRCALRLLPSTRTFSTTPRSFRAVPTFTDTPNAELNEILSTLRTKHLIPAYLRPRERRAIFSESNRQNLLDNPQSVQLGDEEIQLQSIDRLREIPNRDKLVKKAVDLMLEGDGGAWAQNLPALLQGLHEGVKKTAGAEQFEKIVRKASQQGRLGAVLPSLQMSKKTGMSLRDEGVLRSVVWGLRTQASRNGWRKDGVEKAIRDSNVVAQMLESKEHGTQALLAENDPRTRPEVLGQWLELVGVYAVKFREGKDSEDGLVKAYAGRLVSRLAEGGVQAPEITLQEKGIQWPLLQAIPVWHGLHLAQKVLGDDMPVPTAANSALSKYEAAIESAVSELEAQTPAEESYAGQAVQAWRNCIRN